MSIITEVQLAEYSSRTTILSKIDFLVLNESSTRDKKKPLVFLSHKHNELKILQNVVAFLKKEGVDIYVDWMDKNMPAYTNVKTALTLKNKIKISNKFILVATPEAIESKWCNWELGLGDAAKYKENIALLPIDMKSIPFKGAEYLNIYSYIIYQNGKTKYNTGKTIPKGYYLRIPQDDGKYKLMLLKKWLNK